MINYLSKPLKSAIFAKLELKQNHDAGDIRN